MRRAGVTRSTVSTTDDLVTALARAGVHARGAPAGPGRSMSFRWSAMLLGLLVVPALVVAYAVWQRRAAEQRARLADLGLRSVGPVTRLGWRRHLPPAVLLAGVAILLFTLARPEVVLALPKRTGTVIVAIDVSNSMAADDVEPTRLEAARDGAAALVEALPSGVEVGVVAFGDGAQVVAQPGDDRSAAADAIERLAPSGGTSTGAGMYRALEAIVGEPLNARRRHRRRRAPAPARRSSTRRTSTSATSARPRS